MANCSLCNGPLETHTDRACATWLAKEVADVRAQLATNATTIDRLSDANTALAKECDGLRATLEQATSHLTPEGECSGCIAWKEQADQVEALIEAATKRIHLHQGVAHSFDGFGGPRMRDCSLCEALADMNSPSSQGESMFHFCAAIRENLIGPESTCEFCKKPPSHA